MAFFVAFASIFLYYHLGDEMEVGEKIKTLRKNKEITQKGLSELTGIAEITIRQYEANKYKPKFDALKKLAFALGVSLYELTNDTMYASFAELNGALPINKQTELTNEESKLIDDYRWINDDGQEAIKNQIAYELKTRPRKTQTHEIKFKGRGRGIKTVYNPMLQQPSKEGESNA
jgi:transcriptional regulator with XRE-family HTH domain